MKKDYSEIKQIYDVVGVDNVPNEESNSGLG